MGPTSQLVCRVRFALTPLSTGVSWRFIAYALIAGFSGLNLLYLLLDCPTNLAPDEAHYWDWSRRPLQWSYYSKGPLVAWLIRASCEVFGSTVVGIRFPAIVGNALLLCSLHVLTRQTYPRDWQATLTVALALTVPSLAAPAVLMTIDSPLLACWGWATVFTQRALAAPGLRNWILAGVCCALGILAKYTMVFFPLSVALYLLASGQREQLKQRGFLFFLVITGLGLLPIVGWNLTHEMVGFRHVSALAGIGEKPESEGFDPLTVVQFLGGQFGLLIGYWFIAWAAAMIQGRPRWGEASPVSFLWWLSAPLWLIIALLAFKTRGQPNWPVAAYIPGFVLAVDWVIRQVSASSPAYRQLARICLGMAMIFGVMLTLGSRYPSFVRPILARLVPHPTGDRPVPIRRVDPTVRLAGWSDLAQSVDEIRRKIQAEEGQEPVLIGMVWTFPGEIAFYCQGHPEVYTFGPALADRHSQYDLWRPNPLADAQAFQGRTFVYVGDPFPEMRLWFDRVDPPVEVHASDGGIPVAEWTIWVLRGYRGIPIDTTGTVGY